MTPAARTGCGWKLSRLRDSRKRQRCNPKMAEGTIPQPRSQASKRSSELSPYKRIHTNMVSDKMKKVRVEGGCLQGAQRPVRPWPAASSEEKLRQSGCMCARLPKPQRCPGAKSTRVFKLVNKSHSSEPCSYVRDILQVEACQA